MPPDGIADDIDEESIASVESSIVAATLGRLRRQDLRWMTKIIINKPLLRKKALMGLALLLLL